MSKPRKGFIPPDFFGQAKTMFYVEGDQEAVLITRSGNQMEDATMPVGEATAALAWCRSNATVFVYLPAPADRN